MKISEAKKLIKAAATSDDKLTIMMVGIPGIGKTEIVEEVGAEVGAKVYNLRTSLLDATDLTGIPRPDGEYIVKLLPPPDEKAILFFDEVNRGHISTIQATFKIIEGRGSVAYKGSPLHTIVCAINPLTDADVLELLGEAFLSRTHIVEVEADLDDWIIWAKNKNINEDIIKFLMFEPKYFVKSNTVEGVANLKQVPNPRNWVKAHKAIKLYKLAGLNYSPAEIIKGSVGIEAAAAFQAFLEDPEPPVSYNEIKQEYEKVANRFKKQQEKAINKALTTCYDFAMSITSNDIKKYKENISKFLNDIKQEEMIISLMKKVILKNFKLFDELILTYPDFFNKHLEKLNEIETEIKKLGGNNE